MSTESNTLIGHIVHVHGTQMQGRLLEEDEGFSPQISVEGEIQWVGQVGTYVSIRQGGQRALALINRISADPGRRVRSAAG